MHQWKLFENKRDSNLKDAAMLVKDESPYLWCLATHNIVARSPSQTLLHLYHYYAQIFPYTQTWRLWDETHTYTPVNHPFISYFLSQIFGIQISWGDLYGTAKHHTKRKILPVFTLLTVLNVWFCIFCNRCRTHCRGWQTRTLNFFSRSLTSFIWYVVYVVINEKKYEGIWRTKIEKIIEKQDLLNRLYVVRNEK